MATSTSSAARDLCLSMRAPLVLRPPPYPAGTTCYARPESSSGATSHSRGSHGVSMTPADAFVHACGCGQAAVVRRLLAAGTSSTAVHVDVVDAEGWTGLLRSIQAGYTQVSLLLLLEFGAHPEIRTPSGCSALLWAARWGRIDVVKALLSRGANSYARDEMGSTALHHAASNGHMEVAEYLVAQGFRPSTCNHEGRTAYDIACDWGMTSVASMLRDAMDSEFFAARDALKGARIHTSKVLNPQAAHGDNAHSSHSSNGAPVEAVKVTLPFPDLVQKSVLGFLTDRFSFDGHWRASPTTTSSSSSSSSCSSSATAASTAAAAAVTSRM